MDYRACWSMPVDRLLHALIESHSFYWNTTNPMFATLHLVFDRHYTELTLEVDKIAQHMRALGAAASGRYS